MRTLETYRTSAEYQANPERAERILELSAGLLMRFTRELQGDSLSAALKLVRRVSEGKSANVAQAQELAFLAAEYLRKATDDELLAADRAVRNA